MAVIKKHLTTIVLFALLLVLAVWSLFIGVLDVELSGLLQGDREHLEVFLISRLPRLLAILCTGTGMAVLPKDYPSALRALADAEEKRLALETENAAQKQAIADFQPLRQYLDTILSRESTMATSQIAADYDMSARRLNKILHEEGIQHCVNGQWILYREHMGKGYTKSITIPITRSDGNLDTKLHTQWSQKGRLLIHQILTARGIVAVMDRVNAS